MSAPGSRPRAERGPRAGLGSLKYERLYREKNDDMHDLVADREDFRIEVSTVRPEAHLTLVMTALAIAPYLQDATGLRIRIVQALRPIQQITVNIAGHEYIAADLLIRHRPRHPHRDRHRLADTPKGYDSGAPSTRPTEKAARPWALRMTKTPTCWRSTITRY